MKFNLTVKALKDLRVQLGISQGAVARNLRLCKSTFGQYEREMYPMPDEVHAAYENFLFGFLNGEKNVSCDKSKVWAFAKKQGMQESDSNRENEELRKARIQIKEYEALLGMYRKEA